MIKVKEVIINQSNSLKNWSLMLKSPSINPQLGVFDLKAAKLEFKHNPWINFWRKILYKEGLKQQIQTKERE